MGPLPGQTHPSNGPLQGRAGAHDQRPRRLTAAITAVHGLVLLAGGAPVRVLVRVGVATAVLTQPLDDAPVAAPVHRPGAHVVARGRVHGARAPGTGGGAVYAAQLQRAGVGDGHASPPVRTPISGAMRTWSQSAQVMCPSGVRTSTSWVHSQIVRGGVSVNVAPGVGVGLDGQLRRRVPDGFHVGHDVEGGGVLVDGLTGALRLGQPVQLAAVLQHLQQRA